jgi:hypothetical protein
MTRKRTTVDEENLSSDVFAAASSSVDLSEEKAVKTEKTEAIIQPPPLVSEKKPVNPMIENKPIVSGEKSEESIKPEKLVSPSENLVEKVNIGSSKKLLEELSAKNTEKKVDDIIVVPSPPDDVSKKKEEEKPKTLPKGVSVSV